MIIVRPICVLYGHVGRLVSIWARCRTGSLHNRVEPCRHPWLAWNRDFSFEVIWNLHDF